MGSVVPSWLSSHYVATVHNISPHIALEVVEDAARTLIDMWCADERVVHDITHLTDVLEHVENCLQHARRAECVQLAVWYHGAVFSVEEFRVYTRCGGENFRASADFAYEHLTKIGVEEETASYVAELIRGLYTKTKVFCESAEDKRVSTSADIRIDECIMKDAHLCAFYGVSPQRYKTLLHKLREEFSCVSDSYFYDMCFGDVNELLKRKKLFSSAVLREYEDIVRDNLSGEYDVLKKKASTRSVSADCVDNVAGNVSVKKNNKSNDDSLVSDGAPSRVSEKPSDLRETKVKRTSVFARQTRTSIFERFQEPESVGVISSPSTLTSSSLEAVSERLESNPVRMIPWNNMSAEERKIMMRELVKQKTMERIASESTKKKKTIQTAVHHNDENDTFDDELLERIATPIDKHVSNVEPEGKIRKIIATLHDGVEATSEYTPDEPIEKEESYRGLEAEPEE
ncbi:MAG: hypothetical protein J6M18_04815 [Actinomycetaceae bacterium]|nr:hypothetical protein [Actinomycetaceae bacterium]